MRPIRSRAFGCRTKEARRECSLTSPSKAVSGNFRRYNPISMKELAENIWVLPYSLRLFGADLRRIVTVVRLRSGELIIHSTGPFTPEDVAAIMRLGKPGWLLDVMLRHDTFAKQGHEAFSNIPFLAPEGFSEVVGFSTRPLIPVPAAWGDEVEVLQLEGIPSMREHLVFHRPSHTLIVADLLFNFGSDTPAWTRFLDTILACRGRSEWRLRTRRPSNDPWRPSRNGTLTASLSDTARSSKRTVNGS